MDPRGVAMALLFEVIDELNDQLPADQRLEKSPDTPLLGEGAALDSLGFVTLIVNAEAKIEERLGQAVTLADERAMSLSQSPFRTVETFADYCRAYFADGE